MKKAILHFCFTLPVFLLATQSQAQVTVTSDDFPRPVTFVDSIFRSTESNPAYPSQGPDQVWDYSNLVKDELIERTYNDATSDAGFPGAYNFSDQALIFQIFPIESYRYFGLDSEGWFELGRRIVGVSYSITALTGGPQDTLRFPDANVIYDGRTDDVKFPMNYGDEWMETRIELLPYELTVAAFGLNKTPGYRKRYFTQHRKISGYGKLTLANSDGTPTAPMDVLLVRVVRNTVDSIFLGGAPAPPQLMGAFGLTQGAMAADSFYVFYKPGFGAPVMSIDYGESVAFYRPQAAETISAIREQALVETSSFPNPVSAGQTLTIRSESLPVAGQVQLTDMHGRLMQQSFFETGSGGQLQLRVHDQTPAGLYFYQIKDHTGTLVGAGKFRVN